MLRPGSLGWLLAWELRLAWRGTWGRRGLVDPARRERRSLLVGAAVVAAMHLFGLAIVEGMLALHPAPAAQRLLLSALLAVSLATAVGTALSAGVELLFVRSDLELLCASPVPMRSVFAARSLGLALRSIYLPGLLFLPAADVAAVVDGPRWLAAYPVLLCLGLCAATIGLMLTLLLVRSLGARIARGVALTLSVVLSSALFLAVQAPNLLGPAQRHRYVQWSAHWLQEAPHAAAGSWLWYPARALTGDPPALAAVLLASLLVFRLSALLMPRGFALALRLGAGLGTGGGSRTRPRRYRAGLLPVLMAKEWRSIYRDPQLVARLLQRFVGFVPAMFVLLHGAGSAGAGDPALRVTLATVVAGGLADVLVWLAVCAEDAPDLIASAPVAPARIRRLKLLAMLVPVWLAAAVLAPVLARGQPWTLACLGLSIAGITLSAGVLQLWNPRRISRKDIRERHQRNARASVSRLAASMAVFLFWGSFAWTLTRQLWPLAAGALLLAIAAPLYVWLRRHE